MITIKKLRTLGKKTRLRKAALLLQQFEIDYASGIPMDHVYLCDLVTLIEESCTGSAAVSAACIKLKTRLSGQPEQDIPVRAINTLRYSLNGFLGVSVGDWDFYLPESGRLDSEKRKVMPFQVFLDDIRSPFNVGSIFRTAESFGVEKIFVSPFTAKPTHPRAVRTSMGCCEAIPWEIKNPEELSFADGVFALELGGVPVEDFSFPESGIVIIGSEELGVSPEALSAAESQCGCVSIPLFGAKGSLNVSVAFGILMNAWYGARSSQDK